MSKKSHKAFGDDEWMFSLRRFASTGVWPSEAGNRPAPRQKKWFELFQRFTKKRFGGSISSAAKPNLNIPRRIQTTSFSQSVKYYFSRSFSYSQTCSYILSEYPSICSGICNYILPLLDHPSLNFHSLPLLAHPSLSCPSPPLLAHTSLSSPSRPLLANPSLNSHSLPLLAHPSLTSPSPPLLAHPSLTSPSLPLLIPANYIHSPAVDEKNITGMDRVDRLAEYLVELRTSTGLTLSRQQVDDIVCLWQSLLDYDKQRVKFAARHQD
ncbi:hypothetical protein IRJ41_006644, partial [Triplophysa rosa]